MLPAEADPYSVATWKVAGLRNAHSCLPTSADKQSPIGQVLMTKKSNAPPVRLGADQPELFSDERLLRNRVRNRARRLTEFCLKCKDLGVCKLGQALAAIQSGHCGKEVGNDFRYCAKCSHTLNGTCPIDKADIAEQLQEQLAVCTGRHGFELPLCLLRFDVFFPNVEG